MRSYESGRKSSLRKDLDDPRLPAGSVRAGTAA